VADPSPQLNDGRPLLGFLPPSTDKIPVDPDRKNNFRQPRKPAGGRQGERVTPQFDALRQALADEGTVLGDATAEVEPDHIVVFEVVGAVANFMRAAQEIEGFDFIADFVGDGFEPDEDFYYLDDDGDPSDEALPQSLYLVMANATAINQLISLFEQYQENSKVTFPRGMNGLKPMFAALHTIRRWGPIDRIAETGLEAAWREDLEVVGPHGTVPVEIELVWRDGAPSRAEAERAVREILGQTQGANIHSASVVESIKYHALLADLPRTQVEAVLDQGPGAIELLQAENVLFVSPAAPMSLSLFEASPTATTAPVGAVPAGKPKIALLDGMPLANHDALAGRLQIDDPDDRASAYTATSQHGHGTAMASLIIHGDLANPGTPLSTPLHVHPVFVPHSFFPEETTPPGQLFVDVVHAAFEHLFGGETPATPSVRIVNFSFGDPGRMFSRRLSPLARLLDYFAVAYNLVVVVSAGNHKSITPRVPVDVLDDPALLDAATRRSLHEQARHRRLMSPAEAINAITVGAIHTDEVDTSGLPSTVLDPLAKGSVATYSPHGFGFRKSPKPDVHAPGGRIVVSRPVESEGDVDLRRAPSGVIGPGLLVAAPAEHGATNGALYTAGTSNAAALTTRSAHHILEALERAGGDANDPAMPDAQYHPVLVKALLVHASNWPDDADDWAVQLGFTPQQRRRLLTQQLGFGSIVTSRVGSASRTRACIIGAGTIKKDKRDSFLLPLPPSLSLTSGWRRLTVTLAWLSPTMPTTQQYRVAHLEFGSPVGPDLRVKAKEAEHNANGRGTVLHEVLEGAEAGGYTRDHQLKINVDCRVRVGKLPEGVRYGLAATLEVASGSTIDVHQEIRQRLRQNVRQRPRVRPQG
jgi:hypothetical protein